MANDQIDTIIGSQVELTGSLKNSGSIQIFGTIHGDVVSDSTVFVGESATVNGPIHAAHVEVAGTVVGSIVAHQKLELLPKSVVQGDIETQQLSIKAGATFVGASKMSTPEQMHDGDDHKQKRKPRLEIE